MWYEHAINSDWEAPNGSLDMAEAFGITTRRKAGLLLRPITRLPVPDNLTS